MIKVKKKKIIVEVHRRSQDFCWGGRSNRKSHVMTSSKFFEKRDFLRDKDTVEWRIRSRGLSWHVTWVLLNKKDKNLKLKRFQKLAKLGDVVRKLA